MKRIITAVLLTTLFYVVQSNAENIQFSDIKIDIEGGVSASAMYFDNPGFLRRNDSYILNDALLEFSSIKSNDKSYQFLAGVGILQKQNINRINAPLPPVDIEMHYGYLDVPTWNGRHMEIGQLVTKIGYESSISYKNKHALMGALYSAQPNYYPGLRFDGPARILNGYNSYIEFTNDSTIGDASAAIGLYKNTAEHSMAINYYYALDERSMIDLSYSKKIGVINTAINIDYHILDSPAVNQDENAYGIALYANYVNGKWEWPIRLELINDGNTGIYDYDKGYTFTISPTYRINDSQFSRIEILTAQTDGNPFRNDDGGFEDNQFIATFQVGLTF